MAKKWQREHSEPRGDFRIFSVREDRSISPLTGARHAFYVLESPDWVNVIPITRDGQVVLVEQYRHGTEELTLEIPGGMIDPGDGSPTEAARRELREETGYGARQLIDIGAVTPNPALFDNRCHTILALDASLEGAQQLDGAEDITVRIRELETIPQMILDGEITHALVVAGFYRFAAWRKTHPDLFDF